MIGRIQGTLLDKAPPALLIDVSGVAYEVSAPMTTCFQLPAVGEKVCLHTHFVVREDAQLLYGFSNLKERDLFRYLIKVNGIGPKVALAILSGVEAHEFVRCVHAQDTDTLVKIPGIGMKTAERLVIEMRDRLKDWQGSMGQDGATTMEMIPSARNSEAEAINALVSLGYRPQEASKAVSRVNQENISSEELIRAALRGMFNKG